MKKKGLIISTVVMVVVLIASLTTATYAWFTTSSFASIEGFSLEVVSSAAVRIGLKSDNLYSDAPTVDKFVYGDCEYTGTPGQLGGTWTGDQGVGTEINHNINWGQVTKAVGIATLADITINNNDVTGATIGKTTKFLTTTDLSENGTQRIIAANGNGHASDGELDNATLATANGNKKDDAQGDYAYLFLGVQPTGTLEAETNYLYIIVQAGGNGQTLGLAAAVHVAYRLNGATEWTDVDVFGDKSQSSAKTEATVTLKNTNAAADKQDIVVPANGFNLLVPTIQASGNSSITNPSFSGAAMLGIKLPKTSAPNGNDTNIDQIEIVIYIAGADSDCVNGISGVANVGIFFGAQLATA